MADYIIGYPCKNDWVHKIYYAGTAKCNIIHDIIISNAA